MSPLPKAILLGNAADIPFVYPERLQEQLRARVDWAMAPSDSVELSNRDPDLPAKLPPETRFIFSTWGMAKLNDSLLDALPGLEAVLYAAGSVRGFVTPSSWRRGIRIFSAARANAVPVAEFTVAQILLALKQFNALRITRAGQWKAVQEVKQRAHGNFRSTVGLISYGNIARLVRRHLRQFDHEVMVYDPFLAEAEAAGENIRLASLEEVFRECPVVSLHTPLLKETKGLIRGHHLESMVEGGAFINTARGAVVNQPEMTEVLRRRPDLTAYLDVVHPEPPEDEPILGLPNAWITPHIAGSVGPECERMGWFMLEAFDCLRAGQPNPCEVFESSMDRIA